MRKLLGIGIMCLSFGAAADVPPVVTPHKHHASKPVQEAAIPQPPEPAAQTPPAANTETARAVVPPTSATEPKISEGPPPAHEEGSEYFPVFLGLKLKVTDVLLAFFTLGLVIATVGLWISTQRLWLAGERQAKLTRDEFHYVNRPRLTVRRLTLRGDTKRPGINLVLTNLGNLPAARIEGNFTFKIVPNSDSDDLLKESNPPYSADVVDVGAMVNVPPRNRTSLGASERAYIFFETDLLAEKSESLKQMTNDRAKLYVFGWLRFEGPDGVRRESAFFRVYHGDRGKFIASEDPDYEHH